MDRGAAQFRESVRQENQGKSSGRRRFTDMQRADAVGYLERRRLEGARVAAIAEELGLGKTTLERWRSRVSSFVQVEAGREATAEMALVSPSGFRIEGLSLEEAVVLLSRLG